MLLAVALLLVVPLLLVIPLLRVLLLLLVALRATRRSVSHARGTHGGRQVAGRVWARARARARARAHPVAALLRLSALLAVGALLLIPLLLAVGALLRVALLGIATLLRVGLLLGVATLLWVGLLLAVGALLRVGLLLLPLLRVPLLWVPLLPVAGLHHLDADAVAGAPLTGVPRSVNRRVVRSTSTLYCWQSSTFVERRLAKGIRTMDTSPTLKGVAAEIEEGLDRIRASTTWVGA